MPETDPSYAACNHDRARPGANFCPQCGVRLGGAVIPSEGTSSSGGGLQSSTSGSEHWNDPPGDPVCIKGHPMELAARACGECGARRKLAWLDESHEQAVSGRDWAAGIKPARPTYTIWIAIAGSIAVVIALVMVVVSQSGSYDFTCGAGAPSWAQESSDACVKWEDQQAAENGTDVGQLPEDGYNEDQAKLEEQAQRQQEQRELQQEQRLRDELEREQYRNNYNCQVGAMYCDPY